MSAIAGPFALRLPSWLDRIVLHIAAPWPEGWTSPGHGPGRRLLQPAVPLLLLAVLVQSVAHVVNVTALDGRILRFDADQDGSIVSWLGTVTTFAAAFAVLLLALLQPPLRRPLLTLAALLAFLSLDDGVALHELVFRLALRLPLYDNAGYNLWPLVYLPLMVLVGWLLARTARSLDPAARSAVLAGLCCLVVAVALEGLAPAVLAAEADAPALYHVEVVLEEALEVFGWGSIALGLWAGVVDLLSEAAQRGTVGEQPGPQRCPVDGGR